jgi:deoxycytidylate deaminase
MKDIDVIHMLIREAYKSECRQKHAACLLYKDKVVSIGYNHHVSPSKDCQKRWTVHAEVDCLINLPRRLRVKCHEMKLYVIRVDKDGHLRISTPCTKCNDFITKYNIGTTYYSV